VKAVVSVSNPFDCMATVTKLKYTHFGIYDKYISYFMKQTYNSDLFINIKKQTKMMDKLKEAPYSILDVDNIVRAKVWGYTSANILYRNTSCDAFLSYINIPFMILVSKDDPVVAHEHLPYIDVLSNTNSLLIESDFGGHCHYYSKCKSDDENENGNKYK